MPLALLLLVLSQAKVPQRPSGSDCVSGHFQAGGVRLCNLRDALSSVPLVAIDGRFDALELEETKGHGWVGIAALKDTVVGVLDWQVESSGEELTLLVTSDRGRSWTRLPAIKKPHYLASFKSLELKSPKHWVLKIALDDCADCGVKLGVRTYESRDAGAHWTLTRGG